MKRATCAPVDEKIKWGWGLGAGLVGRGPWRGGSRVDGLATCSRFWRFQVIVDEKLAPIVKQ